MGESAPPCASDRESVAGGWALFGFRAPEPGVKSVAMQWKKFRYRLEWLGVKALIAFIPLLSRRACASLARFVGSAVFRLDRKGREVTLANIDAALGMRPSLSVLKPCSTAFFS